MAGEFKGNPIVQAFEPIILSAPQVELTSLVKSPTLAALIVTSITALMKGGTPALTATVNGAVSDALGLVAVTAQPRA